MRAMTRAATRTEERAARPEWLLAPLAVGTLAVVACASTPAANIGIYDWDNSNLKGEWSDIDLNFAVGSFSASRLRIDAKPGKPLIERVEVEVYDDLNDNGKRDPGEPGESFTSTPVPPSAHVELTEMNGNLGGKPRHPRYRLEIITVGGGGIIRSADIG